MDVVVVTNGCGCGGCGRVVQEEDGTARGNALIPVSQSRSGAADLVVSALGEIVQVELGA